MATERRLKQIYFNIEEPEDRKLWEWARLNIGNFSDWGKKHIKAAMAKPQPAPAKGIDPAELAEMVQGLVRIELAGREITTGQQEGGLELPSLDAFF